jgi:hypothetical protein
MISGRALSGAGDGGIGMSRTAHALHALPGLIADRLHVMITV